jgi:hypothetical protein
MGTNLHLTPELERFARRCVNQRGCPFWNVVARVGRIIRDLRSLKT